jgi:hypothetical protein
MTLNCFWHLSAGGCCWWLLFFVMVVPWQVGACIVNDDNIILSIGYNGFPRGCSDCQLPWSKRALSGSILDTKYPYVSRKNAVHEAAAHASSQGTKQLLCQHLVEWSVDEAALHLS